MGLRTLRNTEGHKYRCKDKGGVKIVGQSSGEGGWAGGLPQRGAENGRENMRNSRKSCG